MTSCCCHLWLCLCFVSVAVLCVCGFVCDCAFCFCSWLCLLEFATTKPLNTVLLLQVLVQMCMLCWWDCPNLNSTSLWYKLLLPAVVVQVVVVVVCACGCALCLWLCFVPVHVVVAVLLVQPVPVLLCCWSCRIFFGKWQGPLPMSIFTLLVFEEVCCSECCKIVCHCQYILTILLFI